MLIARKLNFWMHCKASKENHIFWMEMQCKSLERRLWQEMARRDAATARVVNCWTRKQIFWFFAIILTEPRVERSKKKKRLYAWERVKTQNSIHP